MKITGQNYDEMAKIEVEGKAVMTQFGGFYVYFDPEGAIKVAHALIEAAEKIVKK